jgi:hypothetical protein
MRVQIKVNNASETVSRYEVEQGAGAKGQGLRIDMRGQKHVNFELMNEQTGFGPENIATKRVGNDLHIAFEQSEIGSPDLVIEGYYEGHLRPRRHGSRRRWPLLPLCAREWRTERCHQPPGRERLGRAGSGR